MEKIGQPAERQSVLAIRMWHREPCVKEILFAVSGFSWLQSWGLG
jgi:hypothetical protein